MVLREHRSRKKVLLFEMDRKLLLFWIDFDRFGFPAYSNAHPLQDPNDIEH